MPKVTIEIDLPEGQPMPSKEDILRLTDPNWHSDWWHIEDVQEHYLGDGDYITLTNEEAQYVLRLMDKHSNAETGINWDSINEWQEWAINDRVQLFGVTA